MGCLRWRRQEWRVRQTVITSREELPPLPFEVQGSLISNGPCLCQILAPLAAGRNVGPTHCLTRPANSPTRIPTAPTCAMLHLRATHRSARRVRLRVVHPFTLEYCLNQALIGGEANSVRNIIG